MLVKKNVYSIDQYCFANGVSIPVTLGYETYGELNAAKDNVILVAHYFSATSHAAGRYREDDEQAGWWDELIGPGKAIDTNEFFVICMDNLCNVQVKNKSVITTGPASVDPKTHKPYGMTFPPFSFQDMVHIQKQFLQQLGISTLYAVIGPSAGGMIALQWTVMYPEVVQRCIGVITNAQNPIITSYSVLQHGIRAIQLDQNWKNGNYYGGGEPEEGLHLASQMMLTGAFSPSWYEEQFPRNSLEKEPYESLFQPASFEQGIYQRVATSIATCDANHWMYTSRATMLHDISYGFPSLQEALLRVKAKVLLISCNQDLLQPAIFSEETVRTLQFLGKRASYFGFDSKYGHMAGVLETHRFHHRIRSWLLS